MQKRYSLADVTEKLVLTARGELKADLVIQNGTLLNVATAEMIPHTDVAITHGRIALVGDASHTIGPDTQVIDATGLYISPGFMDGHLHVESSMLTVKEYAASVIPHGTTSIFMDPHEIANVLGMKGVELMIQDGMDVPLSVYTTMPSCVPATSGFEDTGATLDAKAIEDAMEKDTIIGLGEMMNFPGVLCADENVHRTLKATLKANKTITGHYSIPENGPGLNAYIAAGARCCHETVRKEDALAKMRLGMYVQMREGSAWHDVKEVIRAITEENIDTRFATLVSDDAHPHTLLTKGHMDHIIHRAIEEGVRPITAIQMATINVAECFHLSRDLGSITPGKWADIALISDLTKVKVEKVIFNGELVAEGGKLLHPIAKTDYPEFAKQSMHMARPLVPQDFHIAAPEGYSKASIPVHVMGIIEAKVGILAQIHEVAIANGLLQVDLNRDLLKVAVIERHLGTNGMGTGFVTGFGLQAGAIASTVAHDAHNLLVLGTNDKDMALAANTLAEVGGGMVVVKDGKVLALNPLPIAGLMSEDPAQEVAARVDQIDKAWQSLGCHKVSPFMTMALISLAVLPSYVLLIVDLLIPSTLSLFLYLHTKKPRKKLKLVFITT
ncbi:adenine deaminase [Sporanaerobium hydrogeniformans]|uniref:adenine deaminase n=1 Tax=Sporanaerobium hydrogeniformans TaxID=3072179 RepID=UPI00267A31A7|nr:adenine deaminase [Sporanaerobium hydrogeniformans]